MSGQMSTKPRVGCLVALSIMMLVVSYLASSSLNPLAVYTSDSILAKIIMSLLALVLGGGLLQLLVLYFTEKAIETTTHKPALDAICPGCGLPLIQFIGSHGAPIICPRCGLWFHNGPACFNKDLPERTGMFHLCPRCRSAASGDEDLSSDLGE